MSQKQFYIFSSCVKCIFKFMQSLNVIKQYEHKQIKKQDFYNTLQLQVLCWKQQTIKRKKEQLDIKIQFRNESDDLSLTFENTKENY